MANASFSTNVCVREPSYRQECEGGETRAEEGTSGCVSKFDSGAHCGASHCIGDAL